MENEGVLCFKLKLKGNLFTEGLLSKEDFIELFVKAKNGKLSRLIPHSWKWQGGKRSEIIQSSRNTT